MNGMGSMERLELDLDGGLDVSKARLGKGIGLIG